MNQKFKQHQNRGKEGINGGLHFKKKHVIIEESIERLKIEVRNHTKELESFGIDVEDLLNNSQSVTEMRIAIAQARSTCRCF